jgi:hypothetical protein
MQLAALTLARYVVFIEPADLNPRGRVHFPDLAAALVDRFGFLKFPQKLEEFDEAKGVLFDSGRAGHITGLRFQIFNNVLVVECASSTEDAEKILEETLVWASERFGLLYKPSMIKRKAYVSQLTFYSDMHLGALNPALIKLSEKLTHRVPQFIGHTLVYQPSGIVIGYDALTTKVTTANFTIERRADTPFSDRKYFSTAPLPTQEHIAALNEFEEGTLASH